MHVQTIRSRIWRLIYTILPAIIKVTINGFVCCLSTCSINADLSRRVAPFVRRLYAYVCYRNPTFWYYPNVKTNLSTILTMKTWTRTRAILKVQIPMYQNRPLAIQTGYVARSYLPTYGRPYKFNVKLYFNWQDEHGQSMIHFAAVRSYSKDGLYHLLQETQVNVGFRDEVYRTARDVAEQANIRENVEEIDRWVVYLAARGK